MMKFNLKNELEKIRDTGKSRIIKIYNLSLKDIKVILNLLTQKYDTFIENNIANLLKDTGYTVKNESIGYKLIIKGAK